MNTTAGVPPPCTSYRTATPSADATSPTSRPEPFSIPRTCDGGPDVGVVMCTPSQLCALSGIEARRPRPRSPGRLDAHGDLLSRQLLAELLVLPPYRMQDVGHRDRAVGRGRQVSGRQNGVLDVATHQPQHG